MGFSEVFRDWLLGPVLERQSQMLDKLDQLINQGGIMAADLTVLTNQVKANTDLEASAIQLINGIAAQLAAAKTDPAKVQALSDQLSASAANLAAAITANTSTGTGTAA
jgi:hypothetical protein